MNALTDLERQILEAFDVVSESGEWNCNRDGVASVNQLAQVVAHGELRIDAWTRHVAAERSLDASVGRDAILETWGRGLPWAEYERIREAFPWDESSNWQLESRIRGRLIALRNRGFVVRDDFGWVLTPQGDELLEDAA